MSHPRCNRCDARIQEPSRFCPECGEALSSVSQLPTGLATPSAAAAALRMPTPSRVGRLASSDSISTSGFTPGAILAQRYRIIGLLGHGGMGEVYRADDLKLGQPVALKFLPPQLAADAGLLDRFFAEVRLARQVSHANVCRVYDVGEADGQQFLSMEYVDGEDLASLLRRIGRLPQDKALDIARQLCAGLAAAHGKGVLHRDLKPANVMIDGRGRARIMDFGLAIAENDAAEQTGGTPAYMAPEQFAGKGASVQSDLYALGLVLYELYTGKRAFDAVTLDGYRQKHTDENPTAPSSLLKDLDPAVERAILRCLDKDPRRRPGSAAQVAAALPGGDPLAAAIAAGETPSPEIVASAGSEGGLTLRVARWLLAGAVALMLAGVVLDSRTILLPVVGSEKSPEVLRARAREILAELGMTERPADSAGGFLEGAAFLEWVAQRDHSAGRWDRGIGRDALTYWYRESPSPLVPDSFLPGPQPGPVVSEQDPPPLRPGMKEVRLDVSGRLKFLSVVPKQLEKSTEPASAADWTPIFRAAGLDLRSFKEVPPQWTPNTYADTRVAWEGPHPERPDLTMRVEVAAYRGRPVSFRWIGPWEHPRDNAEGHSIGNLVWIAILLTLLFGGAWMARRNLRAGRGDRRGAGRLAVVAFALQLGMWLLGAHHVSSLTGEFDSFGYGLANALLMSSTLWVVYVALEPFARRHWPRMLISWARLLDGGWKDPLVGRDLLVGAAAGCLIAALGPLRLIIPAWLGAPPPAPDAITVDLSGVRAVLSNFLAPAVGSFWWVLGIAFFLVLARRILRFEWLAVLVVTLLFSANFLGHPPLEIALPFALVITGIQVLIATRYGLLAAIVSEFCLDVLSNFVITPDPSAWYFYPGAMAMAVVLAIAVFGFVTATAGQRVPRVIEEFEMPGRTS